MGIPAQLLSIGLGTGYVLICGDLRTTQSLLSGVTGAGQDTSSSWFGTELGCLNPVTRIHKSWIQFFQG
jgi:hypothetical protein